MQIRGRKSWIENTLVLVLLGILAGSAGGVAIGFVTGKTATSSSSSH